MNSAAATTITLNAAMTIGSMVTLRTSTPDRSDHTSSGTINGQTSISPLRTRGASSSSMRRTGGVLHSEPGNLPDERSLNGSQVLLNLIAGSNITWRQPVLVGHDQATGSGSAPTITTNVMEQPWRSAGGYVHQFGAARHLRPAWAKSTVAVTFPITSRDTTGSFVTWTTTRIVPEQRLLLLPSSITKWLYSELCLRCHHWWIWCRKHQNVVHANWKLTSHKEYIMAFLGDCSVV